MYLLMSNNDVLINAVMLCCEMDEKTIRQKANDLCELIGKHANKEIQEAMSNNDLSRWLYGQTLMTLSSSTDNFVWIYNGKGCEDFSFEDFLESDIASREKINSEKNASLAKEMYVLLKEYPDQEGHVKITLKRKREATTWTYVVMAIFPEGTRIKRDYQDTKVTKENPGIMFLEIGPACISHACDVLYKELREQQKVGRLRYVSPQDICKALGNPESYNIEFMDSKTRETRDAASFVFAAITGHFSNQETYRMPMNLLDDFK